MADVVPSQSLTRREAIHRILAALAVAPLLPATSWAQEGTPPGIGWDPDLLRKEIPWPRLLTTAEKDAVTVLADLIIPADAHGPAASAVGIPDFIDEWVSAPYDASRKDLNVLRTGLPVLDEAARRLSNRAFAASPAEVQLRLMESIAAGGAGVDERLHALFIDLRRLVAGGYYTTPAGWTAIGYVGNRAMPAFSGPPAEIRRRLGLD